MEHRMTDIFLGPKRYVQRPGALAEAGAHLKTFGHRPMVLGDELVLSIVRPTLELHLPAAGLSPSFVLFETECSPAEIARLADIGRSEKADVIVGTGGGKAIDTARAVAGRLGLPLITIPTSAATCSAASTVSVIYENGIRIDTISGKAAELVLVDSAIIAAAPSRLLAAGMGDSLAKWYEGKPTFDQTPDPSPSLEAALALSTQIKEAIFRVGPAAKRDVDAGRNSPSVEKMIEVNILMAGIIGGIGGNTFRVALAHAWLYGMTVLPQVHRFLHGEVVSYGLVVQACLEENATELERLISFFSRLGLPVALAELGIHDLEDPLFKEGLRRTCAKQSSAHNLRLPVDERILLHAMQEVERRVGQMRA
jgi:glycerol dehydrogenase